MGWFEDQGIDAQTGTIRAQTGTPQAQQAQSGTDQWGNPVGSQQGSIDAFWNASSQQGKTNFTPQELSQYPGVTKVPGSADKYQLPNGQMVDISRDSGPGGANAPAWTVSGGQPGQNGQPAAGGGGGGGGSASSYSAGSSGGSSSPGIQVALPNAPTYTPYSPTSDAPGAFTPTSSYAPSSPFAPTSTYGESAPFSYGGPQAQQLATPTDATYNNFNLPPGFVAPTAAEAQNDPGYQFRLQQGQQALEQSAAAKGILHTGGTLKGLQDYGQNAASQEYANVYGRRLGESQQNYQQGFQTNQANNAGNLAVQQANAQTGLAYGQANNAAQAQNYGQAANTYTTNQAGQAQQYGQQANTYNANQQGQAQQYGQQANTYAQNLAAQNQGYTQGFNTNQANNAGALGNYQAQVNAALGQGNLALGFQNSNNSYALGQGNLAQGYAQLGQNQSQFDTNQNNFLNTNAWNQGMDVARLGNPGAPNSQGYGTDQASVYGQQGNALAAGQVGSGNAWNQALGNIGNAALQGYGYAQGQNPYQPQPGQPGYGVYR